MTSLSETRSPDNRERCLDWRWRCLPPSDRANPRAMPSSSGRRSRATRVFRLPKHTSLNIPPTTLQRPWSSPRQHTTSLSSHSPTTSYSDRRRLISTSTAPGMLPRRKGAGATCTSAGRVTAQLLLSFLALSASPLAAAAGTSRADAQLVIPIDAGPIAPLIPEPPAPAEHTFVSNPAC